MSVKKFKFVSPGIFINEIDNSQLPRVPEQIGPVVIGRARRGPAMVPVKVNSFSEFIDVFGNPIPGGQGEDVWRDGNTMAPTYAAYAAQAWLRNNSPLTFVRLLGTQNSAAGAISQGDHGGKAGWDTAAHNIAVASNGGAFGLFIANSGSAHMTKITGALAAVFYLTEGSIELSGTGYQSGSTSETTTENVLTGTARFINSMASNNEYKVLIKNSSNANKVTTVFNFNRASSKYIRKVFNTNPTLTNSNIASSTQTYWLGETFDRHLADVVTSSNTQAVILGLGSGTLGHQDMRHGMQASKTGWFISQDITQNSGSYGPGKMQKLFRFIALSEGEWLQSNLKVSIEKIEYSTNDNDLYGVFNVIIRKINDTDKSIRVVERFDNCTLNPYAANYIGKKIGTKNRTWSEDNRKYDEFGEFPNRSRFIRVEMNSDVDNGAADPEYLPFGVYGPIQYNGFTILSGAAEVRPENVSSPVPLAQAGATAGTVLVEARGPGGNQIPNAPASLGSVAGNSSVRGVAPFVEAAGMTSGSSICFRMPTLPLRISASHGVMDNPKNAFFGWDTSRTGVSVIRYDESNPDLLRDKPNDIDSFTAGDFTKISWIFSLDDVVATGSAPSGGTPNGSDAYYSSGSRAGAGERSGARSMTAVSGTYKEVLDRGFDRFTAPFFGGYDGLDIRELEPFRNTLWSSGGGGINNPKETTSYTFNSVKRAIDSVADPEVVEANLMTMPGIKKDTLTEHLIKVCEDRGDALAIIDLDGDYEARYESTDNEASRAGDVKTTVDNMRTRSLNSSYGCAYYPWVRIRDSISAQTLWAPPSIVALGTLASAESRSELWFAPAGFTRGGLTEGSAGIPVLDVRERLTSKDRDKLYGANINPIATFPAEGIVIFGQKTLQVTPSALDRINVRRLLIFLKKEVSRMAATILFDQNVQQTWNRFLSQVVPFLDSVKARLGLSDFRVVLDETTTTPDLIDRNILYAKIFLKPARAIEFIALDFVITSTGAAFED